MELQSRFQQQCNINIGQVSQARNEPIIPTTEDNEINLNRSGVDDFFSKKRQFKAHSTNTIPSQGQASSSATGFPQQHNASDRERNNFNVGGSNGSTSTPNRSNNALPNNFGRHNFNERTGNQSNAPPPPPPNRNNPQPVSER